jgi:L-ascorbate metabolism protein UlaG (beta-lactamase superfamily)
VTSLPAQHWSIRGPLDRHQSHWGGYHAAGASGSTLFSGDTGFGPHFAHIAERLQPVDVACLPVGAYSPRWFMQRQHMGPQEAVEAARILGARVLLPVHWGTYRLTDEPLDEPPRLTMAAAAQVGLDVCPLHPGGRYTRAGRHGLWQPPP